MPEILLAHRGDVARGTTKRFVVGDQGLLICNSDGDFYAVEDLCSHDMGELDQSEVEDCRIMCPRHGAFFDIRTGAPLSFPAVTPIRTFPLRVDGDDLYVDLTA